MSFDDLNEAVEEMLDIELEKNKALLRYNQHMKTMIIRLKDLSHHGLSNELKQSLVWKLYWGGEREFPVNVIAEIFEIDKSRIHHFSGPYKHICNCDNCKGKWSFLAKSRTDLKRFLSDTFICQDCIEASAKRDQIAALKSMPYPEYLKTEHWISTRTKAIARAHGHCQICNDSRSLHVHHRTYERRGEELPEDLTVLCSKCHEIFHKNGKVRGNYKRKEAAIHDHGSPG